MKTISFKLGTNLIKINYLKIIDGGIKVNGYRTIFEANKYKTIDRDRF